MVLNLVKSQSIAVILKKTDDIYFAQTKPSSLEQNESHSSGTNLMTQAKH